MTPTSRNHEHETKRHKRRVLAFALLAGLVGAGIGVGLGFLIAPEERYSVRVVEQTSTR